MSDEKREGQDIYKVVVNDENSYSIWPADRENARGFRDAGKSGTKQECETYISEAAKDRPARPDKPGKGA